MDVSAIISDLTDHGFGDETTARQMAVINESYWDVCGRQPWPFLQASASFNFDGTNAAPTNTPAQLNKVSHMFWPATGERIEPMRLDDIIDVYGSSLTQSGQPRYYYIDGTTLKLWPVPPVGTGTVTVKYTQWPAELLSTDLEATILLPKRYHRGILVNGAAYKLYLLEDDADLAKEFEQRYEKTIANMTEDLWAWQYDRPDYIHVTDWDDWSFDW